MLIELSLAHARFDHGITQLFIDLVNPVHSLEDDDQSPCLKSKHGSIPPVVAATERPDRDCEFIAESQDGGNLINVVGENHGPAGPGPGNRAAGIQLNGFRRMQHIVRTTYFIKTIY